MRNNIEKARVLALKSVIDGFSTSNEDEGWAGNTLDLATLWLFHSETYVSHPNVGIDYSDNFRLRMGLERVDTDINEIDTLQIKSSSGNRSQDVVASYSDSEMGLVTYGPGESFWETVGAMEIATRNYIVFPQTITPSRGGWTGSSLPDGTAFRLGELQNVLADLGYIPGGATLPEIELRAYLNELNSKDINVQKSIGVIEAKKEGKGAEGARQLVDHRAGKDAYLDYPAIDRGWLVCPFDKRRITNIERIGGVTWTESGVSYFEAPTVDAMVQRQSRWIELATTVVLTTILRYHELSQPLADAVNLCQNDPTKLYDLLE